jgi:hypothetical protein
MKPERIAPLPPSARSLGLEAGGKLQPEARAFYRRWVGWTVAGEASGFAVAAIAGVLVATQDRPGVAEFALLVSAGSIEGALLGAGQAIAMTRLQLPRLVLPPLAGGDQRGGRTSLVDRAPPEFDSSRSLVLTRNVAPRRGPRVDIVAIHPHCAIPVAAERHSHRRALDLGERPRLVARHLLDLCAHAAGQCEYTDPFADRHLRHSRVADGNHGRGDHWPVLAQLVEERNHPDSERGRLVAERAASGVSCRLTRERS